MQSAIFNSALGLALLFGLCGCGGAKGPELARAGGTVRYNGSPLAGANVIFIPESGPAAHGDTDADGKFVLKTRGQQGAMVGPGTIVITAVEQQGEFKGEEEMTTEEISNMYKSLIPDRFGRPDTSGLSAVVDPKGPNEFKLELND